MCIIIDCKIYYRRFLFKFLSYSGHPLHEHSTVSPVLVFILPEPVHLLLQRQLAHRAGAYSGFRIMKRLGVFLLPLDGMLVHRRSLPSNLLGFPHQFAGTHLYTWVERGTVRVKCLAREHNVPGQGSNPDRSIRGRAH